MKLTRLRLSALLAAAAVFCGLAVPAGLATAQEQGGSGLSISPTRTELNIAAGNTEKIKISVRNVTSGPIVAKPFIADFESDQETGGPLFYKDTNQRNSASIAKFVTGLANVALEPGQSKEVEYTISLPADAAPGAYYGAVTFRAVPAGSDVPGAGEVALTANLASLVLVEVPGKISESIRVTSMKAYVDSEPGTFFVKSPDKFGITIENHGNSFAKPFGTVVVSNAFGKQVYKYEVNNATPRGNILPNSKRTFIDDLKGVKLPGRYTVTANVSHGSGGETLSPSATFWYLPVWFLIAFALLILAVAGSGYLVYRKQFAKRKK